MAHPTYVSGEKFVLRIGSGSPLSYAFVCGITGTVLNATRPPKEAPSRDCAVPQGNVVMRRAPGVLSFQVQGTGQYVATSYATIWTAFTGNASLSWEIEETDTTATWSGAFVISDLNIEAPADGQSFANISITLQSDGDVAFAP